MRSGRPRPPDLFGPDRFSQNTADGKPERIRSNTQERMPAEKFPACFPDDRASGERTLCEFARHRSQAFPGGRGYEEKSAKHDQ